MSRVAAACGILAALACATAAQSHELDGRWQNESGSTLIVTAGDDGQLSGRYCSELGRVDPDSCHAVTGWVSGDVVGFVVRFEPAGSITSWSGQIGADGSGPVLRTLWHLSRDVPENEEPERLWESVIAGFANFRPVEGPEERGRVGP